MKVLIFTKDLPIKNIGGPCGYLYNVREYLKQQQCDKILFYHEWNRTFPEKVAFAFEIALKKLFKFSRILSFFVAIYFMFFHEKRLRKNEIEYIEGFDFVHIHLAFELLQYFKNIRLKHTKIILTTHNPEPYIYEVAGIFNCVDFLESHTKLRDFLLKRELMAYNLCDKIMFPVKEAREPYEKSSILFSSKFKELDSKFFYVPTALGSVDMIHGNDHVLDSCGVPSDAFRICYIGRHNKVKGYDVLRNVAPLVWSDIPNSYFIIGGKEGPLFGLEDTRWRELGWVNTAKILNEVDVFILPNQNTYFDLIFLEILRQGTPVIASKTGGNKWYADKNHEGILFFQYGDLDELKTLIIKMYEIKQSGRIEDLKRKNREFCRKELNMDLYIERYIKGLELI